MSFLFPLCFLALALNTLAADLKTCNPSSIINHPVNLNDSFYWPDGWTSSQNSVPQFSSGQNCVWKFNVPKGMYAYFGATFTPSDSTTTLKLTDSLGTVTTFSKSAQADLNHPYFLVDPSFSVELQSTAVGYLGFRVAWFEIPQTPSRVMNVKPDDSPLPLIGDIFNNATTIQAQSRVSLVSIRPVQAESDDVPTMRLTLVFDGPTVNSQFLGNLWQVMLSRKQIVSSGTSLTLYSVWPGLNLGNIAIVQDYQNVKNFSNYGAINCYLNTDCQFQINATNGTAAAIRYSVSPDYLIGMDIPQTSQAAVYTGNVNADSLIASYSYDQSTKGVPQELLPLLTTYTLDSNVGTFDLLGRGDLAKWSEIFNKRQAVFASPNLGVSSVNQDFTDSLSGSGTYKINFNPTNPGLTGSATLIVAVFQDQTRVNYTTYSATSQPAARNTYEGNRITIVYGTNGAATRGCKLDVSFESKSAASVSLLSMIIVMVFKFW